MISLELLADIRRLYFAEHWKIGTIADQLKLHPDTVRRALETERFNHWRGRAAPRVSLLDPYLPFLRDTLAQYPRLRATRLYEMLRGRGYPGSVVQLRRVVRSLRPPRREAFLRLTTLPGEQAQADWAHFGTLRIGQGQPASFPASSSRCLTRALCGSNSFSTSRWKTGCAATSTLSPRGAACRARFFMTTSKA